MPKEKTKKIITKTFTYEGNRYWVRGATKKETEQKYLDKLEELKNNKVLPGNKQTLDQYHEKWVQNRRGHVSDNTLRKQRYEYKNISSFKIDKNGKTMGSLKLTEIEPQHIRDLQQYLLSLTHGDVKPNSSVPNKPLHNTNSINHIVALLSLMMKDAIADQIIDFNPAMPVKPLKRMESEPEARDTYHRALTHEETKAFFETVKNTWYYNLYVMAINSGMRCGELGALKISDIDFKNKVIHIERTLTQSEAGAQLIGYKTKTKKSKRDIPLTQDLENAIRNQMELNYVAFGLSEDKIKELYPDPDTEETFLQKRKRELSELIFKSSENTLLSDTVVNRDIRRKCKHAGISYFSFHAFRDTFATRCIEQGMNPLTLKEILGHTSLKMTMDLYAHVMPETKSNEMNMIKIAIC